MYMPILKAKMVHFIKKKEYLINTNELIMTAFSISLYSTAYFPTCRNHSDLEPADM